MIDHLYDSASTTLHLRCPVCDSALRAIEVSNVATEIRKQTCRRCRAPLTIKTVPKKIAHGMAHVVTFAPAWSPL